MRQLSQVFIVLIGILSIASIANANQRVVWNKEPIRVILKPKLEKLVAFPSKSVRVKIPSDLLSKLDTLSLNGVVYWTAHEEFGDHQILVQDKATKQTYVITLSADNQHGDSEQLTVMNAEKEPKPSPQTTSSSSHSDNQARGIGYEELTRVAAKYVYAPARLIKSPAGVHRVNVDQIHNQFMIRGHIIDMAPIISFQGGGLYVTAVCLTNKEHEAVELDPRDVRGRWLAATFQHVLLGPSGSDTDTTALYVISARPFWESYN